MADFDPTHHHPDDHDHGHAHGAGGRLSLPVIEEPLDPANQSLADALRASFRVLKLIMVFVVLFFLMSGFYIVDQNEVVVLARLGRLGDDPVKKPGFHAAWPYPIDSKTRIRTDSRTIQIKSFWMKLSKEDELKPLSQLPLGRSFLEPGVDGALLTAVPTQDGRGSAGGAELVHVRWDVTYRIVDALKCAKNVHMKGEIDEQKTVEACFDAASVAIAVRSTVDEIAFQNQAEYRARVHEDAQRRLDEIDSGIRIEKVNNTPYQPLQVRAEFDAVVKAENRKRTAIQSALQESRRILNEMAGEAYADIAAAVREYEKAWLAEPPAPPEELRRLEDRINELLLTSARGKAAEIVKTARAQSDQIVQQLRADANTLAQLKPKYEQNPELLPARMWQETQREIFAQKGVTRFYLPEGIRQFVLWLNRDPEQERERIRSQIGSGKK